jgi:tetraacyldisaccharide-1-P 4'-kinase
MGINPERTRVFRDHYRYRPEDFEGLEGLVLMTEKDAVKCAAFASACAPLRDAWSLRVSGRLPAEWENSFVQRASELVSAAAQARSEP